MNARRRTALIAASVLTAVSATGCYYSTASANGKSYKQFNPDASPARQLALGDSLGGSVWTPVVNERVALARAEYYGRTATASAPTD